MIGLVVKFSTVPELPEYGEPAIGQATIGIVLAGTTGANLLPISNSPDRFVQGAAGPLLGNLAKLMVTGVPEGHAFALAAGHGDRAGTG